MNEPKSLKVFGYPLISVYYNNGMGWLRLLGGSGFTGKNIDVHGLLFSERDENKKQVPFLKRIRRFRIGKLYCGFMLSWKD